MTLQLTIDALTTTAKATPRLVHSPYKGVEGSLRGHCYVLCEALSQCFRWLKPAYLNHEMWPEGLAPGETHWFLVDECESNKDGALCWIPKFVDPTAEQFNGLKIPYSKGKRCGYLTKEPSRRCMNLLRKTGLFDEYGDRVWTWEG